MAGMVVKNNMSAINTLNTLNKNHGALAKSLQKVSSGMRINSAADDASGYAISERMRVQIRSLDQDNRNTQNGNSMMKVAEGAVSSTVEILKTLKEKVINAANDTNTDSDRQQIQKELDQSIDQINDNANVTYNGKYLVDGSHNRKVEVPGKDASGNDIVEGTKTHLTNESMVKDTKWESRITELKSRSGDDLNIHDGDMVTISVVAEGKGVDVAASANLRSRVNLLSQTEVVIYVCRQGVVGVGAVADLHEGTRRGSEGEGGLRQEVLLGGVVDIVQRIVAVV